MNIKIYHKVKRSGTVLFPNFKSTSLRYSFVEISQSAWIVESWER